MRKVWLAIVGGVFCLGLALVVAGCVPATANKDKTSGGNMSGDKMSGGNMSDGKTSGGNMSDGNMSGGTMSANKMSGDAKAKK